MRLREFFDRTMRIETVLLDGDRVFTYQLLRPKIVCKDGVSLSVQGSHTHYCSPRMDGIFYNTFEVGYPSIEPPESWSQYLDGDWETGNRQGIYGRVPRSLIIEFIDEHGGIDEDKTLDKE